MRAALARERFDPATARRTFTIGSADYGELVLLPRLLRTLAREAPGIDLVVRPTPDDVSAALASSLDLAVGVEGSLRLGASIHRRALFDDGFSCLLRKRHPVLRRGGTLDLETFTSLGHVFIAPGGTRGGAVDDALAKRKLERRVVAMVAGFVAAPAIVADSDLVLTVPTRLAARLAAAFSLEVLAPPLPLPRFRLSACWHERAHHDPAHAWLRAAVASAGAELDSASAPVTSAAAASASRRRPRRRATR